MGHRSCIDPEVTPASRRDNTRWLTTVSLKLWVEYPRYTIDRNDNLVNGKIYANWIPQLGVKLAELEAWVQLAAALVSLMVVVIMRLLKLAEYRAKKSSGAN